MGEMPIVRMKPKADARRVRFGYPWVYDNELVLDRRTKALEPGQMVELQDGDRNTLGIGTINLNSKITVRVMSRRMEPIDRQWIRQKLEVALAHRAALYAEPFYRLVHAEADGLPGVIIDRFGDVLVVQPNAAWAEAMFDDLLVAATEVTGCSTLVKNGSGRARGLEGLEEVTEIAAGQIAGPVPVEMNGAIYLADLMGGQKTGLFFDQRENHAFAARLAKGADVLDVFSHVGGFGLAALAGGARRATAIDASQAALDLAVAGAQKMGRDGDFDCLKGDAFDRMKELADQGRKFDLVVCDPPAFAPHKGALSAGLRAYEKVARQAAGLVAPGGYLGLCSCSHAAGIDKFKEASVRGIGRSGRAAQHIHTGFAGPDHPVHPQLGEGSYLKAVFFRLD